MCSSHSVDELVEAIRNGVVQRVQRMVLSGRVDIDLIDQKISGQTPLTAAAFYGTLGMVRWLIEEGGADVNTPDHHGKTPLHAVFHSGVDRLQKVRWLLDHGADINKTADHGKTPLHSACQSHDEDDNVVVVARLLLERGADVNLTDNFGCTPVFEACRKGHFSLLRLLVEQCGADINVKNRWGESPLMHLLPFLCNLLQMNMVQYLVERGADVNGSNCLGKTALHLCYRHADTECARLLLEHGASLTAVDKNGRNALFDAIRRENVDMTRFLLKNGADSNQRELGGSTMLHYCALRGDDCSEYIEILQALLESGANTKLADREGEVPFVVACEKGVCSAVYLLLQKGAGDGSIRFIRHRGRKRRGSHFLLDASNGDS